MKQPVEMGIRDYGWCGRLNARIERWMDRTDWPRIDRVLSAGSAFVLTGSALYFLYVFVDALLSGAFQSVAGGR